jgi:hypothetical protein
LGGSNNEQLNNEQLTTTDGPTSAGKFLPSATILMIILLGGLGRIQLALAYLSVTFGASATVLWTSRAVDAYLEHRNARRDHLDRASC